MSKTLVVIERAGGRRETRELDAGESHTIASDGPVAVTVYGGGEDQYNLAGED